jgi:hypothetical protein
MSSTDISVISANQGTFIVNDATEKTASHDAIVVLEDTVSLCSPASKSVE